MRIAVIGAGNVGSAFGRAAVRAGHHVHLSAVHPDKAREVAHDIGAVPAANNIVAVEHAEVVFLAVPGTLAPVVAAEVARALDGAVVVDATNPLNETSSDLAIDGTSGAEAVQRSAGDAPVVKAFNTIFASRYADPVENGTPLQVLIAGNGDTARGVVVDVAQSLGFAPLDIGGLRFARSLEEMAFLNITLNAAKGWPWQTAWQLVGPMA
jgi:predicted dinucleotide-binding enzyme